MEAHYCTVHGTVNSLLNRHRVEPSRRFHSVMGPEWLKDWAVKHPVLLKPRKKRRGNSGAAVSCSNSSGSKAGSGKNKPVKKRKRARYQPNNGTLRVYNTGVSVARSIQRKPVASPAPCSTAPCTGIPLPPSPVPGVFPSGPPFGVLRQLMLSCFVMSGAFGAPGSPGVSHGLMRSVAQLPMPGVGALPTPPSASEPVLPPEGHPYDPG